jgi:hypothetical protein
MKHLDFGLLHCMIAYLRAISLIPIPGLFQDRMVEEEDQLYPCIDGAK